MELRAAPPPHHSNFCRRGQVLHRFQSGFGINPKGAAAATELWVGETRESQAVMQTARGEAENGAGAANVPRALSRGGMFESEASEPAAQIPAASPGC